MKKLYLILALVMLCSSSLVSAALEDTQNQASDTGSSKVIPKFNVRSECIRYFGSTIQGCRSQCRMTAAEKHYKRDTRSLESIAATAQLGTCVEACNDWYTSVSTGFCARVPKTASGSN